MDAIDLQLIRRLWRQLCWLAGLVASSSWVVAVASSSYVVASSPWVAFVVVVVPSSVVASFVVVVAPSSRVASFVVAV